jgi:4-carboxymuconolactone decarboxylase
MMGLASSDQAENPDIANPSPVTSFQAAIAGRKPDNPSTRPSPSIHLHFFPRRPIIPSQPTPQSEFTKRLPIIPPAELSAEQKSIYDDMRQGIATSFQGFVNLRDDGALLGPWNPWIHEPKFGKPVWELVKAIASNSLLPAPVREVAILVTGAHFRSAYELYAHVIVAEHRGLSDEKLATIVAGQRPADLTRDEAVAYDFASALVNGGVLPELTWRAAVAQFGEHGAAELSYLIGVYCMVSVTLNTFDVPVPE